MPWDSRRLEAKIRDAQRDGLNITMAQAVVHAKENHPWQNRTTTLEGSISIYQYATRESGGFVGIWGSRDVHYALILELTGWAYLRPAADATYDGLTDNIRKAFRS